MTWLGLNIFTVHLMNSQIQSYKPHDNKKILAPLRKKCLRSWPYFILCAHEQRFESVHRLRHHSLHAVVQSKAQQENQAGVQQSAQDAAGQNRAVTFAAGLRGER